MERNSTFHLTENVSNLIEGDDPNILATSYMMYKTGKFSNYSKHSEK